MINQSLINPASIVIVGGSNDIEKPGGKVLRNIIDGSFAGTIQVVNKKESSVQGISSVSTVDDLEAVELAIISVPAKFCPAIVRTLATQKQTLAFIILSAGFAEQGAQGRQWEREIVDTVNSVNGCLIGPNCIGLLNSHYRGVFTSPIPRLDPNGCDLISSSGATAVFLLETGILLGLKFASVFSVGNSAQTGIEEVLEYMDLHHDPEKHSRIKLLYLESVSNPGKLLKHASSLIRKGVRIAAIRAGNSEAGSRAAASHTGALMNPDQAVRALFRKAGIVYCSSREELLSVACVFSCKALTGKNIAVITHAGGPAVMLTDCLAAGGLNVPVIEGPDADELLSFLHAGSSVSNPIDFLATGTAEQLGRIIDYCEHTFADIDAMVVIFGSPGLFDVSDVYSVLAGKLRECSKPLYPVLPSVINAREATRKFMSSGHVSFPDEVVLARALAAVCDTPAPQASQATFAEVSGINRGGIRKIIDAAPDGFLPPSDVSALLDAAGVPRVQEHAVTALRQILKVAETIDFPVVMKVIGPLHKSDLGGVVLNINSMREVETHFAELMRIKQATGVLIQPMITGTELFAGVKREPNFGHLVVCGLGGILIEVLNDVSACLAPVSITESIDMIRRLKGYSLIEGTRGKQGVNEELFGQVIQRLSALVALAPEIAEMDINPLIGSGDRITAVDTRIRIQK